MAADVAAADIVTDAGFPNPHRSRPSPSGLPASLGPAVPESCKEQRTDDCSEAPDKHGDDEDEETDGEDIDEESADENTRETDTELARMAMMERILAQVTPCARLFPVTVSQGADRLRIKPTDSGPLDQRLMQPMHLKAPHGSQWTDIKGLRLTVKPANLDDCILLIANCLMSPETAEEESQWTILRGDTEITPKFVTHNRQEGCIHSICMPYLDQPNEKSEHEYKVAAKDGGGHRWFVVSPERQRRSFAAVTFPAYQTRWVEDDEKQAIVPGPWKDITDFSDIMTTLPGERVLVIATLRYSAQWSSELYRGRFTIVRDDVGLDGTADRGLQSVRALAPSLARTIIMATVDAPSPGPHLYRGRAAVTAADVAQGTVTVIEGDRQLALIRLPEDIVSGPHFAAGPATIEESRWSEVPGLEVTIEVPRPRDKVLLVYSMDCHPQGHHYEAHFTLFRRSSARSAAEPKNLGFSGDFGLDMVSSDYRASSEYPTGLLMDAPGSAGVWTYYAAARVCNMGNDNENTAVVTGYAGSLTAILLTTR